MSQIITSLTQLINHDILRFEGRFASLGSSAPVIAWGKPMGQSIPVLVIEDDEISRLSVEEALKEGGFDVAAVATGEEAIRMLEAPRCEFVAVITDVNLGGMLTGWDVARRAREINDRVAVLFMTGSDGHDWASKGVPDSLLVTKPFAVAQIVTGVAQLLNAANGTT